MFNQECGPSGTLGSCVDDHASRMEQLQDLGMKYLEKIQGTWQHSNPVHLCFTNRYIYIYIVPTGCYCHGGSEGGIARCSATRLGWRTIISPNTNFQTWLTDFMIFVEYISAKWGKMHLEGLSWYKSTYIYNIYIQTYIYNHIYLCTVFILEGMGTSNLCLLRGRR